ncbi:hypothetical protein GSI_05259 [Ganoderma sinense ZZ0214-1]|uniref:C2H2-type domain-containing protein n=1 Tax=Ganoderma sinense ZZ0214-1 TaxID=1077348 RepID=A0A2G8SFL6_9APHY|nr:hypothetical protein GSI_05259 [Ganoderma sinense ZZ0214-1]
MATAQPISYSSADSQDFVMGSGSFTGQNGSFTASSLTRHFLAGSPLSFRSGSFGSRFYPGVSPGQLLGPLDPNDFKFTKMSSSVESDRGPIVNALAMLERQDELCRDYTCCGLNLTDLHALVEHFEECHVVVLDPFAPQQPLPPTTAPLPAPTGQQMPSYYPDANAVSVPSQQQPQRVQAQQQPQSIAYQGFDPDDMELDVDQSVSSAPSSGAPSPPDTPITTPLSGYPSPTPSVATYSAAPSPHPSQPASPISAFDTTTVLPSRGAHHHSHHHPHHPFRPAGPTATRGVPEDAFNAYAGYADYSSLLPGAAPNASLFMQQGMALAPMNGSGGQNGQNGNGAVCAPTALILSGSAGNTPDSTPASSRVASPIPGGSGPSAYRQNAQASSSGPGSPSGSGSSSSNAQASGSGSAAQTARASTTLSRPASSLLLSKPFKCPKPNCNKSYKQANGLKYHMTHGSCNFAPPKDLEHLQELLASKRSEKAAASGQAGGEGEVTLSDAEMREVEKEAERRLRPYACGVGECQRRYKNMNGLRYHYQHSGDHGAIGLALLASGQHECLQHNKSRHATPSHSNSNSVPSTPQTHSRAASQHSSPSLSHQQPQYVPQQQQQQPQPLPQPPTYQSALANPPAYSYQPQPQHQPGAYVPQHYATQHYMPQTQ